MIEFRTKYIVSEHSNGRVLIDIPFNLWNEFGKKGMFEVDLIINQVLIPRIGLLPRGNGLYSIKFTKQIQKAIKDKGSDSAFDELHISISLSENKEDVEADAHKGYRKINNVSLVKQTNPNNCGQACISMLTGINIDEVCSAMHTNGSTSIGQLLASLDYFGISHAEKNVRLSKKNPNLPPIAILTVHLHEYSHWVLFYKGIYFDPEFGEMKEYDKGNITSFLECFE